MSSESDAVATVTRASSPATRQRSAAGTLRAVYPPDFTWRLVLSTRSVVIGRTAADLGAPPLAHETVSRKHLEVTWDGREQSYVARDLGSHNGSRVGGHDIGGGGVVLSDQAVLQLGDVCVVFEAPAAGPTEGSDAVSLDAVPGDAPAVHQLRSSIARAAKDPSPVLLIGETGTGKEWITRELHRLSGRGGPLVAINCSALSPQIIDSQLFGHVKGSFTGATTDQPGLFRAAAKGTLFLDEIGELPLELQPKLLRALQEGEVQPVGSTKMVPVDVRVIAATNRPLATLVESGDFRRDLYARLALWELAVPPLRQRRGDLLEWFERLHDIWTANRPDIEHQSATLSPEAAEAVLLHGWPNNLRELDRLVHELASAPALKRPIAAEDLPDWLGRTPARSTPAPPSRAATPAKPPVPTKDEFVAIFERFDGNVRAMAKHFGRDRRQIYRWIESHGLTEVRAKKP